MKYLVWGTGKTASRFLDIYINCYFFYNPILAFVDNDKEKIGNFFYSKIIISPDEIKEYACDVIFICCSDIESIVEQIKNLNLNVKILTLKSILREMYNFFYDEMKIHSGKLLIVGDEIYKEVNLNRVYMFSEAEYISINDLVHLKVTDYDYILCSNPSEYSYMSSYRKYSIVEYELIKKIEQTGISRDRILTSSVTRVYWGVDKKKSYGEENRDKTFLLIKPGVIAGLGAIVLQVVRNIVYAINNGMIPVIDMKSYKNNYITYDEVGKVNGWEKFFLQPANWNVEDIQKSKNVIESMANRQEINIKGEDIEKYIIAHPMLKKEINEYCHSVFRRGKRILGVKVRGSDYTDVKPFNHCIQPDIESVLDVVREKFILGKYDMIYLCTEEELVIKRFESEFPEKVFYHSSTRVNNTMRGYLSSSSYYKNDLYRIGADYWIELCALSKCNALIAGDCGGTQIALILNCSKYEDVYIFRLGRYGVDDIGKLKAEKVEV